MTTEEHLQQLIGTMAIQLAAKCAEVDSLRVELAKKVEPEKKPEE